MCKRNMLQYRARSHARVQNMRDPMYGEEAMRTIKTLWLTVLGVLLGTVAMARAQPWPELPILEPYPNP